MKTFVCLFALIAAASAVPTLIGETGSSTSSRTQDAAGNYAFAYNEQHTSGGSSRKESGAPGVAQGSYTLNVADGRQRVVKYVADGLGFRAAIATNEPGTAALPAAATSISSPYLPPIAPAPLAVAAPVAVAAPLAAPVLAGGYNGCLDGLCGGALLGGKGLVGGLGLGHVGLAAPVAVAAVPAVSSYSTAVNHGVVAAAPVAVGHAGLGLGLGLGLKGY